MIRAGVLAVALLAAYAQGAAAPSPQPSPLKQIIDVKVRPLCATLGSSVQITLVGLMKNDDDIESGRREFLKLGWDEVQHSKAQDIDYLAIKNVVAAIVHNMAAIDRVLDDPARFPANPQTDEERKADQLKAALQAVEDRQRAQINVLYGTVDTYALSDMRHQFADYDPSVAAGPHVNVAGTTAPSDITDAGLNAQPKVLTTPVPPAFAQVTVSPGPETAAMHSREDAGLVGRTPGGNLAAALQAGQLQT
ncbi:MAG TPA: hypothetical protein VJP76_03810, partial [Candidatus Tumulicola sp.]|nr:hypothetical protein [Candidatus Tumulicola sp.]